jgi:hypothetical protein
MAVLLGRQNGCVNLNSVALQDMLDWGDGIFQVDS